MFIHLDTVVYLFFGFLTVYLMYGRKSEIPVFKSVLIVIFGLISFLVWCLWNIKACVPNPMIKNSADKCECDPDECYSANKPEAEPEAEPIVHKRKKQSKRL